MLSKKADPSVVTMPRHLRYRKTLKMSAILLGALLLGGLGYLGFRFYQDKFATNPCTDEVLTAAAPILVPGTRDPLKPIVGGLEKNKRFEKDPNCVYIALTYYINIHDHSAARYYLDILVKIYDPAKGFSPKLGSELDSIDELKTKVEYLELVNKQSETNLMTFPESQ